MSTLIITVMFLLLSFSYIVIPAIDAGQKGLWEGIKTAFFNLAVLISFVATNSFLLFFLLAGMLGAGAGAGVPAICSWAGLGFVVFNAIFLIGLVVATIKFFN